MRLGLVSALQQEQTGLIDLMAHPARMHSGMREYTLGEIEGLECVCVLSRIGKVAAAATATTLIERFGVTHLVFTGVAGSGDAAAKVGDIVVGSQLLQHDVDASPLFPRFEIPLIGKSRFAADALLTGELVQAAQTFLEQDFHHLVPEAERQRFRLHQPALHAGLIGSGDEFITEAAKIRQLKAALPDLLAVEMEGAAVAQVCHEFGIGFAVLRTISDAADEAAPVGFTEFIDAVAARYAFGIMRRFCRQLSRLNTA
ncbi:adenosylhomocysteine nucleosidase [Noviherbaspirillum humi]|uniref:adenosylhomocysteine nucleosidase n=1 Tax=Noviherbaspirillum humi TaxID=1688639 RepID=A0A239BZ00_9BURK|nr:5'-methylthioadenosine/adenosylhomocysteine nucleosidase [Noviherbaspirillum humi]SNS13227.1 adenosylhomocysteine nucleosidase [Noviherbaspirillum humi]